MPPSVPFSRFGYTLVLHENLDLSQQHILQSSDLCVGCPIANCLVWTYIDICKTYNTTARYMLEPTAIPSNQCTKCPISNCHTRANLTSCLISKNYFLITENSSDVHCWQQLTLIYLNSDENGLYNSSAKIFIDLMENGPNPKLRIEFGVFADKENMNAIPATLKICLDIISKHLANLLFANKLRLWTYPTWRSAFLLFFSIAAKTFKNSPDLFLNQGY